jgi:hypothetical protein
MRFFCFCIAEKVPSFFKSALLRILIFMNYSVDNWKCPLFLVLNMSRLIYYYHYYHHHYLLYAGYLYIYS